MRHPAAAFVLILCVALPAMAETVTVKAVLVDKDLNLKPVPKMAVVFTAVGAAIPTATARGGFDGICSVDLPPGDYHITTPEGIIFGDQVGRWDVAIAVTSHAVLVELSNDNAVFKAAPKKRAVDDLTSLFKELEPAIFTVWSDSGHGTGFLVDASGLIVTNQHVVGRNPTYLSVQFDNDSKTSAVLLASSVEKDVAILRADLSKMPSNVVAKIATSSPNAPSLVEGERVFTIGSPLSQRKIVTTGVASKIEKGVIISDININPGNSGGPLFNSLGEVVGITTFAEMASGPGIAGIVRIEQALSLLDEAKATAASVIKPSPDLLPVEPASTYPLDALKIAAEQEKFDSRPYFFGAGPYDVAVITPVLTYWHRYSSDLAAVRQKGRRNQKAPQAVPMSFQPLDELTGPAVFAGRALLRRH